MSESTDPKLSETNWFPHDMDAHADLKMEAMIDDYQAAGYGFYWYTIELLHAEPTVSLPLKPYVFKAIAKKFKSDPATVEAWIRACIDTYDLLVQDGDFFTSNRARKNRKRKEFVREKRIESGKKGGQASADKRKQKATNAQAPLNQSLSTAKPPLNDFQPEEIRGEEISIDISSTILSIQDRLKAGGLTADGLWEAFASAYPRRYKNPAVMNKARQVLRDMTQEEGIEVLKNLAIDLEDGVKQKFFDDVIDYIT